MTASSQSAAGGSWTVKRALDWTRTYLQSKGDGNPRLSAEWLISEACGMSRTDIYMSFDRQLVKAELDVLHNYVVRRAAGEPLQYITGEVAFRHIMVKTAPGVLIPRPETEVLVSEALSLLPAAPRPRAADDGFIEALANGADAVLEGSVEGDSYDNVRRAVQAARDEVASRQDDQGLLVADICTGSGCIACSIAYEHPSTHVVATDIAPEALALAGRNAASLGLMDRVDVIESDLGEGIDPSLIGSFDLVVSNPPYVPTAVLDDIPDEVSKFEPRLALDGGADGLDLFRRLVGWCALALKPGGGCAFELHETCLDAAKIIAEQAGLVDVRIVFDLTDRPRVLTARKPV